MQDNTEEKRIHTYRGASDVVRDLYSDLELGGSLGAISRRLQLDEAMKGVFIDVVGDIILGLYPKSELKKRLMSEVHLSEDTARQIGLDLKDFLARIEGVPVIPEASKDTRERLELRPEGVARGGREASENAEGPKPLTREEVLQALAPRRTMASDIEHIKQERGGNTAGYETYQSEKDKK